MREVVPARSGLAWAVPEGGRLRIIDHEGGQTGDLFAVAADDVHDGQSNGRTFDYGGTIRLTTGSTLYSRRSRALLRIVDDEVEAHDFLYAPCSQEMFEIQYGATGPRPNCLDNLTKSLEQFGVPASTVTIAFNFFMRSKVDGNGRLTIEPPIADPGKAMTFVAERDVFVAVTACAAEGACGQARSLQVEIT